MELVFQDIYYFLILDVKEWEDSQKTADVLLNLDGMVRDPWIEDLGLFRVYIILQNYV